MEHLIGCLAPEGPCYCLERLKDAAHDEAMSYMSKADRQLADEAVEDEIDRKIEAKHETAQ